MISKFEIVDGQPFEGDVIPIRLFIGYFNLTPTYKDVNNLFSVKYYLRIIVNDSEDNSYFKDQEIYLYRISFWKQYKVKNI